MGWVYRAHQFRSSQEILPFKKIKKNKSLLARKPEKAGQAKIRTFSLSRKFEKGWQAKIKENKKERGSRWLENP